MILKADADDGNHEEPERKARRVLDLEHSGARKFFLKGETFFDLDLPPYFTFDPLLDSIARMLPSGKLKDWTNVKKLENSEGLNHIVFNNRDGRYAWRPMQMVNPVLYVLLVREITEEARWESIRKRFREFAADEKIECLSLPVESPRTGGDRGERISAWWEGIEQRSIELALDYGNMIQTDIADCFGSIYTHSIAWAMHGRDKARARGNRKNMKMLGNRIDRDVQRICGGQTNGIPQGCPLMNFVAEMVLGYADLQLSEKIRDEGIKDYRILRFRDDYRIFTDGPREGEAILKILTETMIELGMRLNPSKTLSTGEIIRNGAIKPDKLFWVGQKQEEEDLQKHLLIIHDLASRFPHSGSLARALNDYHRKLKKRRKKPKNIKSLLPLVSIVADIAYNNPRTYATSCAVISKFLEWTGNYDRKKEIIEKIRKRFSRIPNTGHLEIWLQRLTVTFDRKHEYEENLCRLVAGECDIANIWDFDWIEKKELVEKIKLVGIVDEEAIKDLPLAVSPEEIEVFRRY